MQGTERNIIERLEELPSYDRFIAATSKLWHGAILEDMQMAESRVAGATFEAIAYSYVLSNLPKGMMLYSPEETFAYYYHLFPEEKLIYDKYGVRYLGWMSVPDGLLFRKSEMHKPLVVYEYTAKFDLTAKIDGKVSAFDYLRTGRYRDKFSQAELVFCVPKGHSPGKTFMLSLPDYVRVEEIPFRPEALRKYVDKVLVRILLSQRPPAVNGSSGL